jgi:SAM-dependent methyltransferase
VKDQNEFPQDLILAYERAVDERDKYEITEWKKCQLQRFLELLTAEDKSSLIDIGAGTGNHALYFQEQGIDVICVDISPGNVDRCKEKGLEGYVWDVMDLAPLGQVFEAAFAMNSLLHVPLSQLHKTLSNIRDILSPAGLFFWGQYGGEKSEGIYNEDQYEPKRFFSLLDDEKIKEEASRVFNVEDFMTLRLEDNNSLHFQSLILRVKDLTPNAP